MYIRVHHLHRYIDGVIFRSICEIVCRVQDRELTLWHPHLLTDIVDRVREDYSLRIVDILRCEVHHATHDISWVFSSSQHPADPVDRRIAIAISEGLVHGRDQIVVLLSILIIVE